MTNWNHLLAGVVVLLAAEESWGQVPAGWRGDGTGISMSRQPPVHWSPDTNVAWSTPLPARSNSSVAIAGPHLFVCSEPFDLLCLQLNDGKILWRRSNAYRDITDKEQWSKVKAELAAADPLRKRLDGIQSRREQLFKLESASALTPELQRELEMIEKEMAQIEAQLGSLPLAHRFSLPKTQEQYNGFTTATPTTDGQHVWAVFGNRAVVCYDLDGRLIWSDVLPDNPQAMWGHSSSPLLVGDKLIVNIENTVAYHATSGERAWVTRYGQSWGSAVETRIGDEQLILLANGRILRASDGKVLKRVPGLANASPVVRDGVAYYIDVRAEAHELPRTLDPGAEKLEVNTRWSIELKGGDIYASPIIHDGLIYAVSTQKVLNVVEAATGQVVMTRRLELGDQPVWPSLCLAGENLYVSSRDGTTLVLKAGRQYQELARNELEYFISTPIFHGDQMLVRTSNRLYCIGQAAR
jgi:hypothetical protein